MSGACREVVCTTASLVRETTGLMRRPGTGQAWGAWSRDSRKSAVKRARMKANSFESPLRSVVGLQEVESVGSLSDLGRRIIQPSGKESGVLTYWKKADKTPHRCSPSTLQRVV